MLIVINYVHLSLNLSKLCNNTILRSDHADWYADDHKDCSNTYLTLIIICNSSSSVFFCKLYLGFFFSLQYFLLKGQVCTLINELI